MRVHVAFTPDEAASAPTGILTVCGRRSGRRYSTPVQLVLGGGERWLVAPYGEREWVKNARAAGESS